MDKFVEKRKRGRPKKNQTIINTSKKISSPIGSDEIILHLPITNKLKDEHVKQNNIQTKNNFEQMTLSLSSMSPDSEIDSDDEYSGFTKTKLIRELKMKTKKIEELQKQLQLKEIGIVNEPKLVPMNLNLIHKHNGMLMEHTDIVCWWCTEKFQNSPWFIPDKYLDGKYYIFGCFCSVNCALAYNIHMNDYKVWVRNSLIYQMYYEILSKLKVKNIPQIIQVALPRESLQKFGGHLTIDEYRMNSTICNKEYRLVMPPMSCIIPIIEETYKNKYMINNKQDSANGKMENTLFKSLGLKLKNRTKQISSS